MVKKTRSIELINEIYPAVKIFDEKTELYSYIQNIELFSAGQQKFIEIELLMLVYAVMSIKEQRIIVPKKDVVDFKDFTSKHDVVKSCLDYLLFYYSKERYLTLFWNESNRAVFEHDIYSTYNNEQRTYFLNNGICTKAITIIQTLLTVNQYQTFEFAIFLLNTQHYYDVNAKYQREAYSLPSLIKTLKLNVQQTGDEFEFSDEGLDDDDEIQDIGFVDYQYSTLFDSEKMEYFKLFSETKLLLRRFNSVLKEQQLEWANKLNECNNKNLSEAELIVIQKQKEVNLFVENLKKHTLDNFEKKLLIPDSFTKKIMGNMMASSSVTILKEFPITTQIYDYLNYLTALAPIPLKDINDKMISDLQGMLEDFPHFKEVIDSLILGLRVRYHKNKPLKIKPILIVGDNGIGKNAFIYRINEIFGFYGNVINMSSVTSPFEICGLDSGWSSGKPGFIFNTILKNNVANPFVFIDEIDKKVTSNHNGDVVGPFYDLLENNSAVQFYENYFQTNIDFSQVNYIALANTTDTIDAGILSRFEIFNVPRPDFKMLGKIVNSIYNSVKKDDFYEDVVLSKQDIAEFSIKLIVNQTVEPRKIRKMIEDRMKHELSAQLDGIERVSKKELDVEVKSIVIPIDREQNSKK